MYLSFVIFVFFQAALALDEQCASNSDCDVSEAAICRKGTCQCDTLSYFSNNIGKCLTYATEYKAFCEEEGQCEWLGENSVCKNNRCVCNTDIKLRWYKGKCQKYVGKGETCSEPDDCYDGNDLLSLTCTKNKCVCSTNYYDRNGKDCRMKSRKGKECAIDKDCGNNGLICKLGKCTGRPKQYIFYESVAKHNQSEEKQETDSVSCEVDSDCENLKNSLCLNGACVCPQNHFELNGTCLKGFKSCANSEDCTSVKNTFCFKNSSCVCTPGFFLLNGACVAELGMTDVLAHYTKDSDCPIKPGKRKDQHTCVCRNYWFNDDSNTKCVKTTLQQTKSCLTNEWCKAMGPYAFCNTTTSQCQCHDFAKLDEVNFYCNLEDAVPTNICFRDTDCQMFETCAGTRCECVKGFSRSSSGKCLPDVGSSCQLHSCNHIEGSTCKAGICTCKESYVASGGTRCLQVVTRLNESCEVQEQCPAFSNVVCSADLLETRNVCMTEGFKNERTLQKRCICAPGYKNVNNTSCWKLRDYGEFCSTELDCTVVLNDSIQCRNSLCQCAVGKQLNEDGICVKTSSSSRIFFSHYLFTFLIISRIMF